MLTQQVLTISHIHKAYATKVILEDVSLLVNRTDRIALVGENGVGKTTLANIILGLLPADSGAVTLTPSAKIGYLPQEAQIDEAISVQAYLERAAGELDTLRTELAHLETLMGDPSADLNQVMERYGEVQEHFAARGGYDFDERLDQVLIGLDLAGVDRSRPMHTLSGGEKTRAMLASLLLGAPDVLMLDEPTNHLDFKAVAWLEGYLRSYPGALLLISHDRRFLNQIATQIAELAPHDHALTVYHGNYDAFIEARHKLREKQQAAWEEQQAERKQLQRQIKTATHNIPTPPPPTDNDKMLYFAKGQNAQDTRRRLIARAKKNLERLEANLLERPTRRWQINPEFDPDELVSRDVVKFEQVAKRFGERWLFCDFSAIVTSGERVVLQGANGAGKTTLLRLIMGIYAPDHGQVRVAGGARLGYLDQEQETLPAQHTVLEEFSRGLNLPETDLRNALHKFGLFKEEQVFQPIHTLSIGQRRKLQIARLIAQHANVLILDEPTNHLDLESVDQFEQALAEFPGTIIATSHDRLFIERIATQVWKFEGGTIQIETRH
jgi:ATP-binding cassette subfamily F protein 3